MINGRKVRKRRSKLFSLLYHYSFSTLNRRFFLWTTCESVPSPILKVSWEIQVNQRSLIPIGLENPYSWLISSPKKSFVVRANSDRERQEWLTHLDRCIRAASESENASSTTILLNGRSIFRLDSSKNHSAVAAHWIPDDKATTCMHCHTSKFSAYNRRHVCGDWNRRCRTFPCSC